MAPRPSSPWRKHFETIAARARGLRRAANKGEDESETDKMQPPSPLQCDNSDDDEQPKSPKKFNEQQDTFHPQTPALSEFSDSFDSDDLSVDDSTSTDAEDPLPSCPAAPPPRFKGAVMRREDFDISSMIGRGSYSNVYRAVYIPTGTECALKAVSKRRTIAKTSNLAHLRGEKEVAELMEGVPFVVQTAGTFQTATSVYFVMEYIPAGDLYKKATSGNLSLAEIHTYLANALLAIEAVHKRGAIHRDIKPENFLVGGNGSLKLTDFGFAKMAPTDGERLLSQYGTPEYVAPEVLRGTGYGQPVDLWALGILCYELLVGRSPFQDENLEIMYSNILAGQVKFPSNVKGLTQDAKSLVRGLLRQNPARRLTVEEAKVHPFFASVDFEAMFAASHQPANLPKFQSSSGENVDDGYGDAFEGF
ncbi:unnamed protein product [Discosporangium mesarthrocarpum]